MLSRYYFERTLFSLDLKILRLGIDPISIDDRRIRNEFYSQIDGPSIVLHRFSPPLFVLRVLSLSYFKPLIGNRTSVVSFSISMSREYRFYRTTNGVFIVSLDERNVVRIASYAYFDANKIVLGRYIPVNVIRGEYSSILLFPSLNATLISAYFNDKLHFLEPISHEEWNDFKFN